MLKYFYIYPEFIYGLKESRVRISLYYKKKLHIKKLFVSNTDYDEEDHDYGGDGSNGMSRTSRPFRKGQNEDEESYFNRVVEKEYETIYRSCDKKSNLYILQQDLFIQGNSIPSQGKSNCSRYEM